MESHHPRKLLVTDLDNTLWDWFAAWHGSFEPMLTRTSEMSGVPLERLEAEARVVHQRHGTPEYSLLLDELPSLVAAAGGTSPREAYDEALHLMNSARLKLTTLYPGVLQTLIALRDRGLRIVAYTESIAYWTEWRIRHTELDGVIDCLYSAPDHDWPDGMEPGDVRTKPASNYGLQFTDHRFVPAGSRKPNAEILQQIISDFDSDPSEVVYVGDSLMKDIAMAQAVGVLDVFAEYGLVQDRHGYDLLRRVTHWTDSDVQREKLLATNDEIVPTAVLENSFTELLPLLGLER